jgi:hypothetical protein
MAKLAPARSHRDEARRCRKLARLPEMATLRDDLSDLARQYEELADLIENRQTKLRRRRQSAKSKAGNLPCR